MLSKRPSMWMILLLGVWFSGCGYRFAGGGSLPAGIRGVSISILENRTSETGMENILTNDLIYEFTRNKRAADRDKADGFLSGVIASANIETISHRGQQTSDERRVTVTVELSLTDPSGKMIWTAKDVSANEAYKVVSDKQTTEQNKESAIVTLSKRLAEKVYNRLTEDF